VPVPAPVPAPPVPDDKDWTWVLSRECPDCGYDSASVSRTELPARLADGVNRIAAAARRQGSQVRPSPRIWSAAEYACHVRDVCRVFGARLSLMLDEDNPLFENWDQDATALEARYWEQVPATVAAALEHDGAEVAAAFAAVAANAWSRPGRRSDGSTFTVETLGRYCLHDIVHHVHDVRA